VKRTLSLRRETLAELGSDELAAVVGGQQISAPQATCPVKNCVALTNQFTCLVCFSEPCQTEPNCT
jgi:hypothetical protein